jgi:uncharacterized protein
MSNIHLNVNRAPAVRPPAASRGGQAWSSSIRGRRPARPPSRGATVPPPRHHTQLVVDSRTTVPLEVASSHRARSRGLLGRDGIDGALLLPRAQQVHTFRMRFAIDVAHVARDGTVLAVTTMPPGRIGAWRPRSRAVIEAAAGAFAGWGLTPGVRVEWDG